MSRSTIHTVANRTVADAAMPNLSIALDPQLMRSHFQSALFAGRHNGHSTWPAPDPDRYEVVACEIDRVKYRAGEKCVISYRLQICDLTNGQAEEQWFCARLFPPDTAPSRYQKALRAPTTAPRFGEAVMFLPKLDMVIWAFPNDRKISGLAALMRSANRENDELAQLVAQRWGKRTTLVTHQCKLVHYVPEHTCTVRVELTLAAPLVRHTSGKPTGARPFSNPGYPTLGKEQSRDISSCNAVEQRVVTLFGKAYYAEEGAETYRLMGHLWHSPARRHGQLRIAEPLAYDPTTRVLWQAGLPGRTLLSYELGTPHFDRLLGEAAQAVAQLHTAALPCRRTTDLDTWATLIRERQALVAQVCPHLATATATLATALRCLLPSPQDAPVATLHGDLHLQNFLADETAPTGQRLALIDFDNLSNGSPWHDLGSFCAGLYYRGLIEGVPQPTIRHTIDIFLASYAAHVPWSIDRRTIDWYTAAALLIERAYRSVSRMKDGRLALVDDFIRIATELLVGNWVIR